MENLTQAPSSGAAPARANILLVDDQPMNLLALEVILSPLGQRLVRATSGEEALAQLRSGEFAVVLLDIMMPGLDGLATADLARARAGGEQTPIILVTAGDIQEFEAYAHGAVDILRKPLDRRVVRAKVSVFVELFHARRQLHEQSAHLAEQERQAQARTAALLNASLDAVIGMDHAGRITEFNGAAEAMFGRARGEVLGEALADLLVPVRQREAHRLGLARYAATGQSRVIDRRVELTALRADGTEFPIELAVRRVDAEGLATFLGYVRDLTATVNERKERQRAETARSFLSACSDVLASSIDWQGSLQAIVQLAVSRVADWCAVELLEEGPGSSPPLFLAHSEPSRLVPAAELRQRSLAPPPAPQRILPLLAAGGAQLHEDLSEPSASGAGVALLRELGLRSALLAPITAGGAVLGTLCLGSAAVDPRYRQTDLAMAEDLGRRLAIALENARLYRATQAADARNRFLAEVTEALATSLDYAHTLEQVARLAVPTIAQMAAVYRVDADGGIRLSSLAADEPAREALARELDALLPLNRAQDRVLPRVIRTGQAELLADVPDVVQDVWSPTSRARALTTELRIGSYMVVPLRLREQVVGAISLTATRGKRRFTPEDLTLAEELGRRASLAMENAQLYFEAQEASRLKDEFLATVSHELRTPLTAILGWTHLLRSGRPEHTARAIETIERNARAQVHIVEDVLDVSRIITGKLRLEIEPVRLDQIVQAALDALRSAADAKQLQLSFRSQPGAGETLGDAGRLQQIAWNLLANAIKFTPAGGQVEVSLEQDASTVALQVSDTGIGIRPEHLPRVFERFWQADSSSTRAFGGLGLGLALVRHLVELHGGQVMVHSAGPGKGASFKVVLPLRSPGARSGAPAHRSAPPPAAEPRSRLRGLRLLVVDDEVDVRDLLAALLEQQGAEVKTLPSTRAALELLEHWSPDVLVSDIGMPEDDGYELIRAIRARGVETRTWFPAIALTAYAQPADRDRALSLGYQLHLTKPVAPATLIAAIAELAGRQID
ncbi:MAG TPA: response regulator [Polyangiaceae bacterium]|nr:response regulator [Polyangiaceae bacterium]